jgi:hypothetical protein
MASTGQVQVPVGCSVQNSRCTGDVQIVARARRAQAAAVTVLGRAKFALKRGQTKLIKVAVARKRRKLVTKQGLKATLVVTTKAGDTQTVVRRKVVLKK